MITEAYAYHYTAIYIRDMNPPGQFKHRGLAYCYIANIYKGDEPPWSFEHRGLAYHYTTYIYKGVETPNQSSTKALHTVTLLI